MTQTNTNKDTLILTLKYSKKEGLIIERVLFLPVIFFLTNERGLIQ